MTHTVTFRDYQSKKVITKRGATKWEGEWIDVIDTLYPIEISFFGKKYTFYTRGKDAESNFRRLYKADGSTAMGIWRHGRYGSKMHEEPIRVWASGKLCTQESYASGQIKDQHKYLLSIK